MGMLNCVDTNSSMKLRQQQAPTSPTASVSESNIFISPTDPDGSDALDGLQALKFDGGIDAEIQSPDFAMWESLFTDQLMVASEFPMFSPKRDFMATGSPRRDFMVSSPKRDYMVSSPKRDYMVSSPKRDYMVSAHKREYMVTSPRREMVSSPRRSTFSNLYSTSTSSHGVNHQQGYLHGIPGAEGSGAVQQQYGNLANNAKSRSMSTLHKVYNNNSSKSNGPSSLSCSSSYGHGENLPLPSMDPFLADYNEGGYLGYSVPGKSGVASATVTTSSPQLSECLAMPEPVYGNNEEAVTVATMAAAGGLQMGGALQHDIFYEAQLGGEGFSLQHQMGKADQWATDSSLHCTLGN
jgi:hypothetical protein